MVYSEKYRCFKLVLQLVHADCKYRETVVFTDEPFCTSCPHFVTHSLTVLSLKMLACILIYSMTFTQVYTSISVGTESQNSVGIK